MTDFVWDVFVPGEDLSHRLTTDYLVSEGEAITVDGRPWLVESVTVNDSAELDNGVVAPTGSVVVMPAGTSQV